MARHNVFTVVAQIPDDASERALRRLFEELRPGADALLADIETLHFASFVIFPADRLRDKLDDRITSLLVFECNIDGPVQPFLNRVAGRPEIDAIFRHCAGYPAGAGLQPKAEFLRTRVRRPQLYHIGSPYRSARAIKADAALRQRLDAVLAAVMTPMLRGHLLGEPGAVSEDWRSDRLRPWRAWIMGIAGPLLAIWLIAAARAAAISRVERLLLVGAFAVGGVMAMVAAFKAWISSPEPLRDRVRPWFWWAALGVVWVGAAALIRGRHPIWARVTAAAFVAATIYRAYSLHVRDTTTRLQAEREPEGAIPLPLVWEAVRRHATTLDEGPRFWQPLWNARGWLLSFAMVWAVVAWTLPHPRAFVTMIAVVFLLKSVWLAVLLGWPAAGPLQDPRDRLRIWVFMLGVPAGAVIVFRTLRFAIEQLFTYPSGPLAALVLLALFSLWLAPLPTPTPSYAPVRREQLHGLLEDEDRGVQNHMSAVVVLRNDRPYRVPLLRFFLFVLNRLFFRSWLPDLYRGKLFGIPTVHFAQWVLLDDCHYLFLSNYDNSWTSYLDDFGLRLEAGIQKIWGQARDNPGTKDLARFKHFARTTMVEHSLWCRGYPGLTVRQQWNNERLRRALLGARSEEAVAAALRRFGAAPKTLSDLWHASIT